MSKVTIFDHPLIQHKLSILRDENTGTKEFRELISEIAMLMCYEATRDLPLEDQDPYGRNDSQEDRRQKARLCADSARGLRYARRYADYGALR